MNSRALVPIVVVLANASGLATQALLPRLVKPQEYTAFSLASTYGVLLCAVLYEWLRQPVLRFGASKDPNTTHARHQVLTFAYLTVSGCLVAVTSVAAAGAFLGPWTVMAASVGLYALCQGPFDAAQALARAELSNRAFSSAWIMRSLLGSVVTLGVAAITGSGELAFIAFALSYLVSLIWSHSRRLSKLPFRLPTASDFSGQREILTFGAFAAASTAITALYSAIVKAVVAGALGTTEGAGPLLAFDISQKVILIIGLAVNIVVSQTSYRIMEFGSSQEQRTQLQRQIIIPTLLILPAAAGLVGVQYWLTPMLAPEFYQASYSETVLAASAAAAALALRFYAIDPALLMGRRYRMILVGPLVTIGSTAVAALLIHSGVVQGIRAIALTLAAAPIVGLAGSALALTLSRSGTIPMGDALRILISVGLMIAAVSAVPRVSGLWHLTFAVAVGIGVYASSALFLNAGNSRELVRTWLQRRMEA